MKYTYETLKFFNNALIDVYKADCGSSNIVIEDDSDNKVTYLSNSHILAVIPTDYCSLRETANAFNRRLKSFYDSIADMQTQPCSDNGSRKKVSGIKRELVVIDCADGQQIHVDSKYYKLFDTKELVMRANTDNTKCPIIKFFNGEQLVGVVLGVKVK